MTPNDPKRRTETQPPFATRFASIALQHVGLPAKSKIHALEIRWPDRDVSLIDGGPLQPNSMLTITRRAARTEQPVLSAAGQP